MLYNTKPRNHAVMIPGMFFLVLGQGLEPWTSAM